MSQAIITKSAFFAHLNRLGAAPKAVDEAVRFALFHGAQGQFTPANSLVEKLSAAGIARGDVGRAALAMLADGLAPFAVLSAMFKKRDKVETMGTDGATTHALNAKGIIVRMDEMSQARIAAKEKTAANKAAKAAQVPADTSGDKSGDDTSETGEQPAATVIVSQADAIAAAVAEHVEYVRIARQNAARAYALQCKADQDTLEAVRAKDDAVRALESARVQIATLHARIAELESAQVTTLAQSLTRSRSTRKGAQVALAA